MKILYISYVDVSLTKGPSANEREFIPSLYSLKGEDAHFVIPEPEDKLPIDIFKGAVTLMPSSKGRKPHLWIKQQFKLISIVNKLLKDGNIDLIIMRPDVFAFALRTIVKKNNIPYALKTAGSGKFDVFRRKGWLFRSLYSINQKIFMDLVRNSIVTDVVSPSQRDSLVALTGVADKVYFVDNGVNTDRFYIKDKIEVKDKLGLSKYDKIVGYAGNFPWERGGMQIVEALPKLVKKFPKIGGVILGSGDKMHLLFDRAKELGVEDHVVFPGSVDYTKVVDYINSFDVAVSQRYEDTQSASELKVRQYLACGKPTIVSPSTTNNFIQDNSFGFVVDSNDFTTFGERVADILSYREDYTKESSERIRKYAEEHLSYDSKIIERLELYKKALNL